ncbi:MAG TPA: ankyrin [Desulfoprunum sp.]|nr:ankyrin [Desulfoprunum sp.]
MSETNRRPCPTCQGKKIIEGVCEASSEWRGTSEDEKNDTQCTPDQECPTCHGKGYVVEDSARGPGRK